MPLYDVVTGIWPPSGFATALFFLTGRRCAPGVLTGAVFINAAMGVPLPVAVAMGCGNTGGAWVGARILRRMSFAPALERLRDVGALALAAVIPTLLSALVGVTALVAGGPAPISDVGAMVMLWWSGDALGVLLVAPVVFLTQDRGHRPSRHEVAEGVLLIAILATLSLWLFSLELPYVYAIFPAAAVLAFRVGPAGAAAATAVVSGIATASTVTGHGPFTAHAQVHNLFLLQLFIGLLALKGLVLAAATAERRENRDRLAGLSRRLLKAHEAERRAIARGLHDDVGQTLTAVKMGLETLRGEVVRPEAKEALQAHVQTMDHVMRTVRDLSFELHPAILDDLGLAAALRHHTDRLARHAGFRASVDVRLGDLRLASELEAACFRLAQEALSNVAHHARASAVEVQVRESDDDLELLVRDDGIGFDPVQAQSGGRSGIGILGMHERAALVGGRVEIFSVAGEGTTVVARFPLRSRGDT